MDSLFDERPPFDLDRLRDGLKRLTAENIYVGGSSWKYEGWIGQIYSRQRYLSRGRFSQKMFEAECLREYAETFPAVCGDFAFYQFPSEDFWKRLFAQVPPHFRFAFKVPEQITCKIFPTHPRYGAQGGLENPTFLDPRLLTDAFLRPLLPYRERTAALIFEFGAFSRKAFESGAQFAERLHGFLKELPPEFRYSVEIRNPEFLGPEYFGALREHRVAHVFNAWSKMPELKDQIGMPESVTSDFVVCRALLRRGRVYEDAVRMFHPYSDVQDPNPEVRDSLRVLIREARDRHQMALLFVNNRLEGNAPGTILSLVS